MDLVLLITIVGGVAALITVLGVPVYLIKEKPNLIVSGGGQGGILQNVPLHIVRVRFWNRPTLLGVKVHRGTARIKRTFLYDPQRKEVVEFHLIWQTGPNEWGSQCAMEAGEQKELFVLALDPEAEEFFAYVPHRDESKYIRPKVRYTDRKRELTIVLQDTMDREYRFDFKVTNRENHLLIQHKISLYNRTEMIRDAFQSLKRAFFTPPGTYL